MEYKRLYETNHNLLGLFVKIRIKKKKVDHTKFLNVKV